MQISKLFIHDWESSFESDAQRGVKGRRGLGGGRVRVGTARTMTFQMSFADPMHTSFAWSASTKQLPSPTPLTLNPSRLPHASGWHFQMFLVVFHGVHIGTISSVLSLYSGILLYGMKHFASTESTINFFVFGK